MFGQSGGGHAKGGGRYPGVGYVLSNGGTVGATVCFRVVGYVGGNDKDGGRNARRISPEDHREEGMENHKQDVGNTSSQRGVAGV